MNRAILKTSCLGVLLGSPLVLGQPPKAVNENTVSWQGKSWHLIDDEGVFACEASVAGERQALPPPNRPAGEIISRRGWDTPVKCRLVDSVDCTQTDHGFEDDGKSRVLDLPGGKFRVTGAAKGFELTWFSYTVQTADRAGVPHLVVVETPNDRERYTTVSLTIPKGEPWSPPFAGQEAVKVNSMEISQEPFWYEPDVGLAVYTGRELPINDKPFTFQYVFFPKAARIRVAVSSSGWAKPNTPESGGAVSRMWVFEILDRLADRLPKIDPPNGRQRRVGLYATHPWYFLAHYGVPPHTPQQRRQSFENMCDLLAFCGMNLIQFNAINGSDRAGRAWYPGSYYRQLGADLLAELPPVAATRGIDIVPVVTSITAPGKIEGGKPNKYGFSELSFRNRSDPYSDQRWRRLTGAMGDEGFAEIGQHVPLLEPQRLHRGENPFGEPAPRLAVVAEADLPPQHRRAQRPLRPVVRRLDPLDSRERPHRRVHLQEVPAEPRRLRHRARKPCLQRLIELDAHRSQGRLQPRPVQDPLAEVPPQREDLLHRLQTRLPDPLRLSTPIQPLLEIPLQVRPAKLPPRQVNDLVRTPAIRRQHTLDVTAQELPQGVATTPRADLEERHAVRDRQPQPTELAGQGPTGLVRVLHRRFSHRLFRLFVWLLQGRGDLLLYVRHAPQRQRHAEERLGDLFHRPLAVVATAAQIGERGRQIRAEGVGQNLRGDRGPRDVPATRARAGVALVLGDDREDLGQFGHLVPRGLWVARPRLLRQRSLASLAPFRHVGNHTVHPLGRQTKAMVSGMPWLPAGLASCGRLRRTLRRRRRVRRRRNRRVARVRIESPAEFADFGFELSDPSEQLPHEFGQLGTLRATRGRFRYRVVHKPFIGRRLRKPLGR